MAAYNSLVSSVHRGRDEPAIMQFARASILLGMTTHLECCLVTSIPMGSGLKKNKFIGNAILLFKSHCPTDAPGDSVHPQLAPLLKLSGGGSSGSAAASKEKEAPAGGAKT